MSGLFGSSLIKGTRITDFGTTTAEIGIPLPFGYGRAPYDGNVIFCPMPPVEQRHVTRQGKGGVKQESFTYSLSYSISFMKGQCYGYWWIKRNGKVVWTMDPNAPIEDQAYAQKWAEKVNFHYGTADQMPDAVIESYEGAGNVSAFRNLTYFTVEDDDVTDGGGAVPSYEACLIASPPEAYLTSHPYTQFVSDTAITLPLFGAASTRQLLYQVDIDAGHNETEIAPMYLGALTREALWQWYQYPEEGTIAPLFLGASTKNVFVTHAQPPDTMTFGVPLFNGASTRHALLTNTMQPEAVNVTPLFNGASTS